MRIPHWLQGALFAPACAILIFVLKVTCPAQSAGACFADPFVKPLFYPLPFLQSMFGHVVAFYSHEPLFILAYWVAVGAVAGAIVDIYKRA